MSLFNGASLALKKGLRSGAVLVLFGFVTQNASVGLQTASSCLHDVARPAAQSSSASQGSAPTQRTYYGFDANEYPGDKNLAALRRAFAFSGFWLNTPPGATSNPWSGKRTSVEKAGFGFLVLFNGRLDAELRKAPDVAKLGEWDGKLAVETALKEGFPSGTVIFLDIEEGGRMLPEQKAYIYGWVDELARAKFRAGVYCSGIAASEGHGITVVTANDLRENAQGRSIIYWVANDGCPPSPGCRLDRKTMPPAESGVDFASVWQFAQSPRRPEMTRQCKATYNADQNCYGPSPVVDGKVGLDLNTANEDDPSHGRTAVKGNESETHGATGLGSNP